jgi:hypothetical protein
MSEQRELGWNGVRFQAPADWQIARIGRCDLLMERKAHPVFEIKWAPIRGRFSHGKTRRRLAASSGRRSKALLEAESIPASWRSALKGFDVEGFSWQEGGMQARGLTLFCPKCGNAAVLQFFRRSGRGGGEASVLSLLRSFADHPETDLRLWSVFDVHAELPADFIHLRHRFQPGAYEMAFRHRTMDLTLFRWAAAPVWTRHRSFAEAAGALVTPPPSTEPEEKTTGAGHRLLEWREQQQRSWARRLFGRGSAHRRIRLWHDEAKGRILGFRLEDCRPIADTLAECITASYRSV